MSRPNLSEIRKPQILDAFVVCIGRHGLEGTTLARIAQTAGMKRTILRHYIGNRDNLIQSAAERIVSRLDSWLEEELDSCANVESLLDSLFDSDAGDSGLSCFAKFVPDARNPEVAELIQSRVKRLQDTIAERLGNLTDLDREARVCVAEGWTAMVIAGNVMAPIEREGMRLRASAFRMLRKETVLNESPTDRFVTDDYTEIGVND
tara:strand:+ start:80 stop:697 length:618 start_codon:yes stop_codon:yes gene_type:complete